MTDEGPDILDVEPPVAIPEVAAWWAMPLIIVALVLLGLGLWWWLRWRTREADGVRPKTVALQRLARLQGQVSKIDGYHFGVEVSDILRAYLNQAHDFKASEQTSREFLDDLKGRNYFTARNQAFLEDFLKSCDFLKYAPAGKAEEPNQELLEQTTLFIRGDIS